jgi:TRAP-type mannitol/chloroaromatic compound transport system permease small subunit
MSLLTTTIDRLSRLLAGIVMAVVAVLVAVMVFEVFMRRALNAPTLWAFDVAYMLNGVIFLGASSYALMKNEHIRIDFLSARFSPRARHVLEAVFLFTLVLPALFMLAHAAVDQAWQAFVTGQIERVSPWAPKVWPFYAGLAVGAVGLWLQALAEALRNAAAALAAPKPAAARTLVAAEGD